MNYKDLFIHYVQSARKGVTKSLILKQNHVLPREKLCKKKNSSW